MPSQDDTSPTGQNSPLYRSATSAPSAAQARAGATHAPENLIVAITSPRHPQPPADATSEPRMLLAARETDIANMRDQKGSYLTAPRPFPSRPGRATISPPHDAVAANATATTEMTGLARPWEERATRSAHTRRTHVKRGRGKDGTADIDRRRRQRRRDDPIVDTAGERRRDNLADIVGPRTQRAGVRRGRDRGRQQEEAPAEEGRPNRGLRRGAAAR
jgi:hypothetical protein